ncbi:alpha-acetolactate decarboxylase [Candidatus Omnitrophus magneticus]|uniref:Alpha-acetolactate decarboxylase n=1 Tax=Candidatus Omnitrophus magneticus TaxID=1609969 RepID=A0A0F0CTV2_9BACT|nr:alpha-acetolactate decarboxylase [Candidatus Omnitrophus magneticus]
MAKRRFSANVKRRGIVFRKISAVFFILIFLSAGCKTRTLNGITQIATIDALLAGGYDGYMSLKKLRKYGDFGIGTYDKLDGEMILFEGKFYKVRADGKVYKPSLMETTPFACVTEFVPDKEIIIKTPTDLKLLEQNINIILPENNHFCAFFLRGNFSFIRTRSVPIQKKPYPILQEVTKNQTVFEFFKIRGTLIGFRSPDFTKGVNVPGYHIHFIADDFLRGGHVLDFEITDGVFKIDTIHEWLNIFLPTNSSFFKAANLSYDRQNELQQVESNFRIK